MAWDTINRLKEIIIQAGTSLANGDKKVTWDYNADSQRYKEMAYTHNGSSWVLNTSIYFIWERGSIIQKRIGGTTAYSCTNFFKEGEMRCLNNAAPTKYYYTHDHLGSVYEMTDTAAAVQAAYSYVAYGERIKRWGAQDTEIAYTKHWNFKPASFAKQAAADLSLTWYRAYDTKRGVWLSRDPIDEKGGINLYAYVSNSPINLVDPLGLAQNALHRGSCCNRSSKDEWALVSDSTSGTVKDYWKKLSPGDCVRSSGGLSSCGIDCEGMTCKGKFYAIKGMGFALTATCTDGPDQFPFKDKGWTPGDKSEKGLFGDKLSPGDKSNQVGNTPPGYQYQ
jgi:RHS repeat-associated protein